mmetsp:Transcript_15524/g.33539  ORF Transcript_15524/g.33539 Transcript_15524/m.33539 type:complete len:205 (-) Transcript_15524:644-1258(-)
MESLFPKTRGTIPASSVRAPSRKIVCRHEGFCSAILRNARSDSRAPARAASPPMALASFSQSIAPSRGAPAGSTVSMYRRWAAAARLTSRPMVDRRTTCCRVELYDAALISSRSLLERSLLSAAGTTTENSPPAVSLSFQTNSLWEASQRIAARHPSKDSFKREAFSLASRSESMITVSNQFRWLGLATPPPTVVIPPKSHFTE